MKTRNIISVLGVVLVVGGCAERANVLPMPENHVAPYNDSSVSRSTTFMNGTTLSNGATFSNGTNRALALITLSSRSIAKKD